MKLLRKSRRWWVLGVLSCAVGAAAAQRQDPEHPWPDHEPPPGYVCRPARSENERRTNINACACLGMLLEPMCPETDNEREARINSSGCKSWCKPQQCECRGMCKTESN